MTTKEDLIAAMQAHVDSSGDENLRMAFGEPNHRVVVDNETEETGQSWTAPNFIDSLMHAIGEVIDGGGALHSNVNSEFTTANGVAEKLSIHDDDRILIEDSEANGAKKWIKASLLIYTPPIA